VAPVKVFWMMLAGSLGVAARYGVTLMLQTWMSGLETRFKWLGASGAAFPLGTLVINVTGTLLLSMLVALALHGVVRPELRLILGTGFLGAYTTFSTFELEAEELLARGTYGLAALYIGGNLLLGFGAVFLGRFLALRLVAWQAAS
jgi:CrcB protein